MAQLYFCYASRCFTKIAAGSLIGLLICSVPADAGTSDVRDITVIRIPLQVNELSRNAAGAPRTRPIWWGLFGAGNGAASGFGTVGLYGQARWAEDWSYLATGQSDLKHKDWFDRLKYMRLSTNGAVWISFSGETRLRYIFENQPAFGKAGVKDASRILLRNQYGADLHLGTHVRIYVELLNAEAGGTNSYGYQLGTQRERLDMQQGFFEVKGNLLGAHVGAMGGRQLFLDAPVTMQSARDLTNVQQTWDGFRGYAIWKRFRLDIFDFWQTDKLPVGIFSNGTNYSARMYGAYSSTALPEFHFLGQKSQFFMDLFYLGYLYGGAAASIPTSQVAGLQKGTTRRDGIGGRLWGKAGPLNINLGGVYQGGRFHLSGASTSRPVRAYAINATVSYTLGALPGAPTFGVQADIFSGGNFNSTKGPIGTFGTPYVPLPYYNDITTSLINQNLIDVGPVGQYAASKKIRLQLHIPFFWRADTNDAVYGVGRVYAPRNNLHGGYIGTIPQGQVAWSITPHFIWTHDIAGTFLSKGMRCAGAKSGAYYMQTLSFIF
ncbi:alginate export family protein [Acetobacter thailandicus]|uniref:alginate export family protein n=1 Tax=Acetobacter thailandicus TaxID=1502842 RepID=UPI001BA9A51D|nr:alginate export family protein [Acetobacter thailandicus]